MNLSSHHQIHSLVALTITSSTPAIEPGLGHRKGRAPEPDFDFHNKAPPMLTEPEPVVIRVLPQNIVQASMTDVLKAK